MFKVDDAEYKTFAKWWMTLSNEEAMEAYAKCYGNYLERFSMRGLAAQSNKKVWDKYTRIESQYKAAQNASS